MQSKLHHGRARSAWSLAALLAVAALLGAVSPAASAAPARVGGDPEIVGGVPAQPGAFPYQVAIVHHDEPDPFNAQFCGGSLIAPDTVLTAAHCLEGESVSNLDVRSGIIDLVTDIGDRSRVRQVRIHPRYDPATNNNDVAILQLVTPLPEAPVAVAQPSQTGLWRPGTLATITGWGDLTGNSDYPTDMHEADVPLRSDEDCAAAYGAGFVAGHMLCAGVPDVGGIDTCQGDSGGPIVVDDAGTPVQVGLTSFGDGCALADFPGVYTRLDTYFAPFIERFLDPDGPPDAPRSLAVGSAFGTVRATWRPPFFDGGTPITGYKVRILPGGRVFNLGRAAYSLDVVLAPGITHTFKVKAHNATGLGAPATASIPLPIP